jgi:hypothetical protein
MRRPKERAIVPRHWLDDPGNAAGCGGADQRQDRAADSPGGRPCRQLAKRSAQLALPRCAALFDQGCRGARIETRGVRLGRPKTGTKVEAAIRARLAAGEGVKKVAKAIGVGNGTVSRIKGAMAA